MPKAERRTVVKPKGPRGGKKDFAIGAAFEKAFDVFKKDKEPFLTLSGAMFFCAAFREVIDYARKQKEGDCVLLALMGLLFFVGWLLKIELIRLSLRKVKGKSRRIKTTFGTVDCYKRSFIAGLLTSLAVLVGLLLLVVPGFIVAIGLCLSVYVVLEYRVNVENALRISWELTRDVKMRILGFGLVSVLAIFCGALCCGVGLIVAWPVTTLAWVVVYRELERQTRLPKFETLKAKV